MIFFRLVIFFLIIYIYHLYITNSYLLEFLRQRIMPDDELDCLVNNIQFYFSLSLSLSITPSSLSPLISHSHPLSLSLTYTQIHTHSLSHSLFLSFFPCDQTSRNRERSKSVSRLIESENHDYQVQRYK